MNASERPNILWFTTEDMSPNLGCYGDAFARTPHLDAFAARGQRFLHVWSNAPVCAPARTAIISGMHPPSTGSEHMRSLVPLPQGISMYPELLRQAGYYCTNNLKEDYNLKKNKNTWDQSNGNAHWKNRPADKPFFSIFNHTGTHESQNRKPNRNLVSDPAKVPIPPYHPDTAEVRGDWAQYYDNIAAMDQAFQRRLDELDKAGLSGDTIIFFYSDHGAGMPRHKRWPGSTGMRVPLIVYFPEKWQHLAPKGYAPGASSSELLSFVDLAPTLLSLANAPIPGYMQGRAFCGHQASAAPAFLHGFRSRMDERYDFMRSVTDGRHVYIRHYMPHVPYGTHLSYQSLMPTMQVWEKFAEEGRLNPVQADFWKPKPVEALYDLKNDPWETVNLAADPAHATVLAKLRRAHQEHVIRIRDLGFIPESERIRSASGRSPHDAFSDNDIYPIEKVLSLASLATDPSQKDVAPLLKALEDPNPILRYWGACGLLIRGRDSYAEAHPSLKTTLADVNPSVRITAAHTIAAHGEEADKLEALGILLQAADIKKTDWFTAVEALNAILLLEEKADPIKKQVAALPSTGVAISERMANYIPRLIESITAPGAGP